MRKLYTKKLINRPEMKFYLVLASATVEVTRVATQGREDRFHWVTKYHLQHSNNGSTFLFHREHGKHFSKVSH